MKKSLLLFLIIVSLFLAPLGVNNAEASARTITWIVSVTYQNVGNGATPVEVSFFQEGSNSPVTYSAGVLAEGAAASFYMGNVTNISAGFRGNAIMSSSQPLVATVVQFHQNAPGETVKMRMLSNSFSSQDGSNQYLVATVLANTFNRTTIFSVQNLENEAVNATLNFYKVSDGSLASTKVIEIPANSSRFIELDQPSNTGLPSSTFNGSVIVTATKKSSGNPANVIAAASELYTNVDVGANFEGVPLSRASNNIYLSTALCKRYGLDTYYAVQNASLTSPAEIKVTYYNTDGTVRTVDGPYAIGPGQKRSITTCAPSSGANMAGFTGSAVVATTNPASKIVAIGKAQASLPAAPAYKDVFTIFNGEPSGYTRIALPFVRWAEDARFNAANNFGGYQRTYIAIQNLSNSPAQVDVSYFDKSGNLAAKQTLSVAPFAKVNSDANAAGALGKLGMTPGAFGYYTDGSFGGGVIIEANPATPTARFIAIARVQHPGAGEDYNGISISP